ncbi:hypothetical protein ACIQJT_41430 [Streptomyces sp. NPDC091972]|uniref:hypothetical protein n=1 Tax=Streptomyces sp. NPDC091972 TaxID=3366007 RepID=UPI00381971BE
MSIFRFRETPADDNARTNRLCDAADRAFETEQTTGLGEDFESVVMEGLLTDKAAAAAGQYPPAGHTYPRKD